MIFPLTADDKGQLKRLNDNKLLVFALKKLFLNVATKSKPPADVNVLAAERIALDIIQDVFSKLETLQPDSREGTKEENLV
mgnify:CR=1 FL=1